MTKPSARKGWIASLDALKIIAGISAAAGLLLHLVGSVRQDVYLQDWNLDPALFPKTIDRLLIAGYETTVTLSFALVSTTLAHLPIFLIGAACIGVYWSLASILLQKVDAVPTSPNWLSSRPDWFRLILSRSLLMVWIALFFPLALYLLNAFLAMPIALAANAAHDQAVKEKVEFAKGCKDVQYFRCIELKRGSESLHGFLIDASGDNLAFYDAGLKQARILPRAGLEIFGYAEPRSETDGKAK